MQENFQKIGQPWVGQGGTFVGLMRGENDKPDYYLVLADEKADDIQWGEYNVKIEGADSEFDGLANTSALIQHNCPAAKWAVSISADGHNDFYLPSPREHALLVANVPELIGNQWHWSSRQYSAYDARITYFEGGNQDIYVKDNELAARAVRRVYPLSHSAI